MAISRDLYIFKVFKGLFLFNSEIIQGVWPY